MLKSRSALESYPRATGRDGADGHPARAPRRSRSTLNSSTSGSTQAQRREPRRRRRVNRSWRSPTRFSASRRRRWKSPDLRIAPDQYWVSDGDEPALEARLRAAIPADAGCVTSLDGARTRLFIEGPRARDLLGRLVPIDLHPTVFPVRRIRPDRHPSRRGTPAQGKRGPLRILRAAHLRSLRSGKCWSMPRVPLATRSCLP